VSWSVWMKVHKGKVIDTLKSGDAPEDFTVTVSGHRGDNDTVAVSITSPIPEDSPNIEAKEVKPE
jgi:hypothetical protein